MRLPEAPAASGGVPGPGGGAVAVPRSGHSRNSSLDMRHNPQIVGQGGDQGVSGHTLLLVWKSFFILAHSLLPHSHNHHTIRGIPLTSQEYYHHYNINTTSSLPKPSTHH